MSAVQAAHDRLAGELGVANGLLVQEAEASQGVFHSQLRALQEQLKALKHENGTLNDDNTALTVMRARSVRKGLESGFRVMVIALQRFTMRRQVQTLRSMVQNKHEWDRSALQREYRTDKESLALAHAGTVDSMLEELRSLSSHGVRIEASKTLADRRGGRFALNALLKSQAKQELTRCVTRWRAAVIAALKSHHTTVLELLRGEHGDVVSRLTAQLMARQSELERCVAELLELRETQRATEDQLEQKIALSQGIHEELVEARQEIGRVKQQGEDEAHRAKRLAFEAFNSQLEGMQGQLATAQAESRSSLREIEELYDELQLAHDQLTLCKVRVGLCNTCLYYHIRQ